MDKKNILIIKENDNDFEKFYNKHIRECGVDVATPDQFRLRTGSKVKKIINLAKAFFVLKNGVDLKKYDLIIIFEDVKIIPIVYKHKKNEAKIILWNWNIKTRDQANEQKKYNRMCEIWTFDKNDAQKYGWDLNNQFYFNLKFSLNHKNEEKQVFLACVDKGRYQIAREIRRTLMKLGVVCDFWLVKQNGKIYDEKDSEWLKDSALSYDVFLEKVQESDIVIDLVQEGQSGITVRILEAIMMNKKIITNNCEIRKSEFYDSQNIYIWNKKNDENQLINFINRENCVYDDSIKGKYMFDNWINKFY